MIKLSSFDLAVDFMNKKLLNRYTENDVFGVQLSDNRIGYCLILGQNGTHLSLSVYIGNEGIQSLATSLKGAHYTEDFTGMSADDSFYLHSETCLQCYFEEADMISEEEQQEAIRYFMKRGIRITNHMFFPCLTSWRDRRMPYPVNREEENDLVLALQAALYISDHPEYLSSGRKVFPYGETIPLFTGKNKKWKVTETVCPKEEPVQYFTARLPGEEILNEIRNKPIGRKSAVRSSIRVGLFKIEEGVSEEDPAAYCPVVALFLINGKVVRHVMSAAVSQDDFDELVSDIADLLCEMRQRPSLLTVDGWYGYHLMEGLCKAVGISLEHVSEDEEMDRLFEDFYSGMEDPDDIVMKTLEQLQENPEMVDMLKKFLEGMVGAVPEDVDMESMMKLIGKGMN